MTCLITTCLKHSKCLIPLKCSMLPIVHKRVNHLNARHVQMFVMLAVLLSYLMTQCISNTSVMAIFGTNVFETLGVILIRKENWYGVHMMMIKHQHFDDCHTAKHFLHSTFVIYLFRIWVLSAQGPS